MCERPAIAGYTHPNCRTLYTLDGLTSFFHYKGVIGSAVRTIKYRFAYDISCELVSMIAEQSLEDLLRFDVAEWVMVPIPLHKNRLHERGFNQAEILGKLVADRLSAMPAHAGQAGLQIPVRTDILLRTRYTTPQVEMKKKKARLQNMHGVFAINPKIKMNLQNKTIVLFDDVFTTGATMRSAARVLKHAGAKRVWAVTIAR